MANLLINRFTDARRMTHNNEVYSFYNDCKDRLTNPICWKHMSLFNHQYHIVLHDKFGKEVNRNLQTGDYIKILAQTKEKHLNDLWFMIEDIDEVSELNLAEQSICITLRESNNPSFLFNKSALKIGGVCELHLRRLINTISMDVKIFNEYALENIKNFFQYFRWEMLVKSVLLQL